MGFKFVLDDLGGWKIVVADETAYVVALDMAPPALEESLRHGRWLVVSMAVWSGPDREAGRRAVELVKRQKGLIGLGLRPFDYPAENVAWVPGLSAESLPAESTITVAEEQGKCQVSIQGALGASPLWAAIREGKFVGVRFGMLADEEIEELIARLTGPVVEGP